MIMSCGQVPHQCHLTVSGSSHGIHNYSDPCLFADHLLNTIGLHGMGCLVLENATENEFVRLLILQLAQDVHSMLF